MLKELWLAVSLVLVLCQTGAQPAGLDTLHFDRLDDDLDELAYKVEEEDLDDFSKLLDAAEDSQTNNDNKKTSVRTTGYKKKGTANRGSKKKYNNQDLKKFYKTLGARDRDTYDDEDDYGVAEKVASQAVGITGNENRTYRKGTKTRGFHRVHHKDEYKKDKVFYEDDETKGVLKKVGAKASGFITGAGAGFSKGHHRHDRTEGRYGKRGYSDKGFSDKQYDGYSDSQGFDGSFSSES